MRTSSSRRGQGLTEYILLVALVAIASIGVVTLYGDNIRALFGMSDDALAGDTFVAQRTTESAPGLEKKGLAGFASAGGGCKGTVCISPY